MVLSTEIISSLNESEIEAILKKKTTKKPLFLAPLFGKFFFGILESNSFTLKTYDSPPMTLEGIISRHESGLKVELEVHYSERQQNGKAFTYSLGLPLVIGIFIWRIFISPTSVTTYLIGLFSIVAVFLLGKFNQLVEPSQNNPHKLIKKLMNELQ